MSTVLRIELHRLASALLILCCCVRTVTAETSDPKLDAFLSVAEELRTRLRVPGVGIGIIAEDELVFADGIGYRNVGERAPVTANTLFAIGSNTKAFTGLVVSQLVVEKELSWDEPIISYIPGFTLSDTYVQRHVTLADACSHMTGLARSDALWKGMPVDREQVFRQASALPFDFSLRSQFSYNNHMYVVVGKAIECVTSESWEDNVRSRILRPLKMTDSYATYNEFMNHAERSIGYDVDGTSVLPHVNVDNVGPAGSLSSTPRDFIKWLKLWVSKGALPTAEGEQAAALVAPEAYANYAVPRSASMAGPNEFKSYWAGWGEKIVDGEVQFIHSGSIDGQSSRIVARPADRFGIFVMTNQQSDYKDLLVDYAQEIFLTDDFQRDTQREDELALVSDLRCLSKALLDGDKARANQLSASALLRASEPAVNQLGYGLLEQGKPEEALFVFRINTAEHPQSSNAWDSLAECYFHLKQYPEAITHYQKSIELDGSNKNAAMMIARIEELKEGVSVE